MNDIIEAIGKGSILLETRMKGRALSIRLYDVLHVPDLHFNLLLMSKFISRGLKMHFNSLECVVRASNGKMLVVASLVSNIYQLDTNVMNGSKTNPLTYSDINLHSLEFGTRRWGISKPIV